MRRAAEVDYYGLAVVMAITVASDLHTLNEHHKFTRPALPKLLIVLANCRMPSSEAVRGQYPASLGS